MAAPTDATFGLSIVGPASAALSARLVCEVLASRGSILELIADRFPDFFSTEVGGCGVQFSFDGSNLFGAEPIDSAALRAGKIVLQPSDRYVELVSAVALCGNVPFDFDLHGWPVLLLNSDDTAMTLPSHAGAE